MPSTWSGTYRLPVPSAAEILGSLPRATPIYLWLHARGCLPWVYARGYIPVVRSGQERGLALFLGESLRTKDCPRAWKLLWIELCPSNSYGEALTLNVIVFGDGTFGRN